MHQQQQQQQQQHSFHTQQQLQTQRRGQPLLQNPPSNPQQQQQFSSHLVQQLTNNPNISLQAQNPLGINALSGATSVSQQNSLEPWLALYAAALNPQTQATQQSQQDTNSLTQQWAHWLKTTQMVTNRIFSSLVSKNFLSSFRHKQYSKLNLN